MKPDTIASEKTGASVVAQDPPRKGLHVVPTDLIAPRFTMKPGEFMTMPIEIPGYKIPLTTEGQLRLVFIGVGSAFASRNFQTNFFLVKGKNAVFVDVGTLTNLRLRTFGITPVDIEKLILTHSHADHVGGVEEVALKWRYMKNFMMGAKPGTHKPKLYCPEDYQVILWERSLRGGLGENELDERLTRLDLKDYFELHAPVEEHGWGRPAYRTRFGEGKEMLETLLFRTKHVPDAAAGWQDSFWSCGMRIDERVLFTGDTRFDRDLLDRFGHDVEVIFHDCQSFPGGVHANYAELKALPDELKKKMYLLHLDDGMYRFKPEEDGFLGFAQDGLSVVYDLY